MMLEENNAKKPRYPRLKERSTPTNDGEERSYGASGIGGRENRFPIQWM